MAKEYNPPGVYINEIPAFPPSVAEVESAVPAFIGYTPKAKVLNDDDLRLVPRKISSLLEYENLYGTAAAPRFTKVVLDSSNKIISVDENPTLFILYHSLRLYFDNGGGVCYIVSIGNYSSAPQKNDFINGVDELSKYDEPTLLLFPDAVNLPGTDLYEVQKKALKQAGELGDRFCIFDLKFAATTNDHNTVVNEFRNNIGVDYLKYGAAYTPYLNTTFSRSVTYRHWKEILWKNDTGINLKDLATDSQIRQKITELENAIALNDTSEMKKEDELMLLFPEMRQISDQLRNIPVKLPASAAVAGQYCNVDRERGVWKAPANVSISSITGPALKISAEEQESLNIDTVAGKSINVIRSFTGKGTLIWGARTLAGNDNEWRYIPVRRFFNMIEESVTKSCQLFVFEPNDANTWVKIKTMIENYLFLKWRDGALAGAKPEQAFFVHVGLGQTMTAQDILEGRMIIEIGMAPLRPAEFIILRISIKVQTN